MTMTDISRLRDDFARIVGDRHVYHSDMDMGPYLRDVRGTYSGDAVCLLRPGSAAEVAEIARHCNENDIVIVPVGGNTGVVGGAVPDSERPCILINLSRMNGILDINPRDGTVTVEAGCILAELQNAVRDAGYLLPLSLSSEGSCQIGGNIATNAGGTAAVRYGVTREQVLGLEVVLPSGKVLGNLSKLRKDNAGYDLKHLFIGSEGTLGIITAAVMKIVPAPRVTETALLAVGTVSAALDILNALKGAFAERVTAAEIIDAAYVDLVLERMPDIRLPFDTTPPWVLLLEVADGGADAQLGEAFERVLGDAIENGLAIDAVIAQNETQAKSIWHLRHAVSDAVRHAGPSMNHDSSVPLDAQPDYANLTRQRIEARFPEARCLYVGHVGDGNLHLVVLFPTGRFPDKADYRKVASELDEIVDDVVVQLQGSITAEHGIGISYKQRYARIEDPEKLALMRQIKSVFDPRNIMNAGKMFV